MSRAYSDQNILLIDAAGPGLLAGDHLRERAQAGVAHDLHVRVRPRQALPHPRVVGRTAAPHLVDDPVELVLVLHVLRRRVAAPLVAQGRHRDPPAVVQAADHVRQRRTRFGDEGLAEVAVARDLADRAQLDAVRRPVGSPHRQQHVGDAPVLRRVGIGAAQAEHHVRPVRAGGPHLLSGHDDLVAVDDPAGLQPGQIRTGVGLGESLAVTIRPVDDARQEVRLLLVGAVHDDRRPDEPLAHAPRARGIPARPNSSFITATSIPVSPRPPYSFGHPAHRQAGFVQTRPPTRRSRGRLRSAATARPRDRVAGSPATTRAPRRGIGPPPARDRSPSSSDAPFTAEVRTAGVAGRPRAVATGAEPAARRARRRAGTPTRCP